jgi:hypothetical protein
MFKLCIFIFIWARHPQKFGNHNYNYILMSTLLTYKTVRVSKERHLNSQEKTINFIIQRLFSFPKTSTFHSWNWRDIILVILMFCDYTFTEHEHTHVCAEFTPCPNLIIMIFILFSCSAGQNTEIYLVKKIKYLSLCRLWSKKDSINSESVAGHA